MHDGKTASENILTIFARSFWLLPLLASADPVPPNIKHVVEPLTINRIFDDDAFLDVRRRLTKSYVVLEENVGTIYAA